MYLYFLIIRIAAFFGHKKARMMVRGQEEIKANGEWLKANKGAIWFHAASVGEFEQARPIIERLKNTEHRTQNTEQRAQNTEQRAQNTDRVSPKIVVTFFSPSGYEMRKNYPHADGVYYLPFATRRNAERFLEALQPKMAIFVKYEFWPAYLRALKKRNIPTYSICAIFRPKQYLFSWWGKPMLKVLNCFTHIFVQDEASQALLNAHGITQTSVAGDTRFDRMMEVRRAQNTEHGIQNTEHRTQNTDRLSPIAAFAEGCARVIVAGSTWPKDEVLLAKYMRNQQLGFGNQTKLILVPHEIDEEHLHGIFNQFEGRLVRYSTLSKDRFTDRTQNTDLIRCRRNILEQANVLLIDTMGLLSSIYRFGQVAYIGGGFGVGIHNTIEAAAYGLPVVFGPNYHHFREAQGLIDVGAARSISNYQEIEDAFETGLRDYKQIGQKAAEYVQSELGATDKIYAEIFGN